MTDTKANDVCENFVRKESNMLIQYYHEESLHGSHYVHKSTSWNMRDLELLTKACKKNKCVFTMLSDTSVFIWSN